jgi:hypothetical protein
VQSSDPMSILSTVAVALLLAADPTEVAPSPSPPAVEPVVAPPASGALAAPVPASPPASAVSGLPVAAVTVSSASSGAPSGTSTTRSMRAGFGISVTNADDGYASTVQAGVEVDPWNLFGFRGGLGMTTSVFGAGGWDAAELSGSALFRPLGGSHRVTPYLGAGVQFALLAIFPDAPPPTGQVRVAPGHLSPTFLGDTGANVDQAKQGFGGTNQFKVMPELTAGALFKLTSRVDLDVAARYLPLSWNGTTYNGLSIIASVCAPF